MILRTTTGRSFKGVGQYVLHDKGTGQSADRVAFVETENLTFNDGQRAIAEMIHTAKNQKALRRRNGDRATATSKPVYHYALSWETNEAPSLQDQMEAARDSLKALGLEGRQAMIVGHTDTDNPHVHVVVNLVHPETGKTASLSNDRVKLSKWAQHYREERGEAHLCPQRAANNARRSKGEFVKANNMTRQEYEAWKKAQTKQIWDEFRAEKAAVQDGRKGQLQALWQQKEERFAFHRDGIKQRYKPLWREVFQRQRQEVREFDSGFVGRMKAALRQGDAPLQALAKSIFNGQTLRGKLIAHHEAERKDIGTKQKGEIRDASREVTKAYKYDLGQLKESFRQQDQARYDQTKAKSAQVWKDKTNLSAKDFDHSADRRKDGAARSDFDEGKANDEPESVRKARREKIRKRRERKRNRPRRRGDTGRTMDP